MTRSAAPPTGTGPPADPATAGQLRCAVGHPCLDELQWRCPSCRRPWELATPLVFRPELVDAGTWSLWRYRAMLPVRGTVTLGEGGTPLVPVALPDGGGFLAKLEYLAPTGSYKDRGTALVVNHLAAAGATEVVEDSSGNAGASLAAYAAAAGLSAVVYVPSSASSAKKRQITEAGARVVEVPGGRAEAARAAHRHGGGAVYASHCWSPLFLAGQATCAWELWEQLDELPDAVVCPVGQGNLLLGLARGFAALRDAGLVGTMPRLYAAQSTACAPLALAWQAGAEHPVPVEVGPTVAEGILSGHPVRGAEILRVLRETGGGAVAVDDDAVLAARRQLRLAGLSVEPTSAVAVAALSRLRHLDGARVVVPLTGSGLKSAH